MRAQFNPSSLHCVLRICFTWMCTTLASALMAGLIQSEVQAAQVTLRWDYAASGAAGFMLYCGPSSRNYPTRVDAGNTDTYAIGTLPQGATSFCAVTAYDSAKVESGYSSEVSVYVPAAVPSVGFSANPGSGTAPLSVAFTNTTTGEVTSWAWSFGDGTSSNLKSPTHVYSTPGSFKATLTATGPGGTATKTATTAITVTQTADTTPPSTPAGLTATAAGSAEIDLLWTASSDAVGVTGYRIERCQGVGCTNFTVQVATPSVTNLDDEGLAEGTSYSYRVRATDAAGNLSGYSNTASATTQTAVDTTQPTVPLGLTAKAVSASRIDLTWSASTDNVGIKRYRVQRCQGVSCTNFALVAKVTGTSFSDAALASNTSYRYRVRAVDQAGNLSGFSSVVDVKTPAQ